MPRNLRGHQRILEGRKPIFSILHQVSTTSKWKERGCCGHHLRGRIRSDWREHACRLAIDAVALQTRRHVAARQYPVSMGWDPQEEHHEGVMRYLTVQKYLATLRSCVISCWEWDEYCCVEMRRPCAAQSQWLTDAPSFAGVQRAPCSRSVAGLLGRTNDPCSVRLLQQSRLSHVRNAH